MKKSITIGLILCLLCGCLVACTAPEQKTLVSTEAVEVVACGRILTVTDKQTGQQHEIRVIRVKRTEAAVEAVGMISTPTLTIRRSGRTVEVIAGNEVYIITIDRGGYWKYAEKG